MLDEFLRQRRVRSNIEIVYTYPTVAQLLRNCLFMQQEVCEVLPAVFLNEISKQSVVLH